MLPVPIASVRFATLAAVLLLAVVPCPAAEEQAAAARAADARLAAELLPASTVFYAEVERPKDLIGLLLDHPLRERLEKSPEFRKAIESQQFKELREVVAVLEQRSGVPWRKALEAGTGGGLAVAFDGATQGVILLARSQDPKTTRAVRDTLFALAREDGAGKGKPDPVKTREYRGITAYQAGEVLVGDLGPWMVISNKVPLAKSVADAFLDAGESDKTVKKLAGDDDFTKALASRDAARAGNAKPTVWAFLRLAPIRQMAAGKPAFDKDAKGDDAAVELLFGGLFGPLRNAPYVTASLALDKRHVKLSVTSPHDRKWVPEERKFFFAPAGEGGGAAKPLRPNGTLLSITTYRDLAAWWAAGPDLLTEGAAAKMAQADSGLSAFLGGKSFGGDVLGAVKPQIEIVAASQDYKAAGVPEPTIRLPAFAIVLRLKEKEAAAAQIRKHFRVAFQSIVALANLDGSAKGRPMLTMNNEKRGKAEIWSAGYEPEDDAPAEGNEKPKKKAADAKADGKAGAKMRDAKLQDIHYNFSPAVVMSKDHLILCSTRQIAHELADLVEKQEPGGQVETTPDNTRIEIAAGPAAKLLRDNREQLIAQNVLEKGHDRDAAEKEIDLLVTLVSSVKDASLRLTPTDDSVTIELDVTTATPE